MKECPDKVEATEENTRSDMLKVALLDSDSKHILKLAVETSPSVCHSCKHLLRCATLVAIKGLIEHLSEQKRDTSHLN